MTVLPPIAKPVSHMQLAPGSVVTFPDVSWLEFETILQELGEHRSARVAYSHHTLEIMVPLPEHEKLKDIVSDIVKILLKSTGRRYEPFGSTTFKQEGITGVEPDACFYIQNYRQMVHRRRLESTDPPPDLAIEMAVTSKTTLAAYQAIGVPEVWIYARQTLMIYLLQAGEYVSSPISPLFPTIPLIQIIPTVVERSWQVGTSQALEEFEQMISSQSSIDWPPSE